MRFLLSILTAISVSGCVTPQQSAPPSVRATPFSDAEIDLATRLFDGLGVEQNREMGFQVLKRAAKEGHPAATLRLGRVMLGGSKSADAVNLVKAAASQNLAEAQADLALLYLDGKFVERDLKEGSRLASLAAAQGNAKGTFVKGRILTETGDHAGAVAAFRKAADLGDVSSPWFLARAYASGRGVERDALLAYVWADIGFRLEGRRTDDRALAARVRDDAALLLLPPELDLGRTLARAWKPGDDLEAARMQLAKVTPQAERDWVIEVPRFSKEQPATDMPVTRLRDSYEIEVQPDGTHTTLIENRIRANNDAAVGMVGERRLRFDEHMEKVEILEATTVKPDGRRIAASPSAVHTRPVEETRDVPMYSDRREKVVIFPGVEAGDTVVYRAKVTTKPTIPGLFSSNFFMDQSIAQDELKVRIVAPKSMPLRTETKGMGFKRTDQGEKTIYDWSWSNPTPTMAPVNSLDVPDWAPRLAVSSFTRWEQFGQAYGALIAPRLTVTPPVRKLADEITAGIGDRRAQAEAIYNWVSRRIRYVAIDLGNNGGWLPHLPDEVIANGYGDCKDHSALLVALLRAKGIDAEIVLINANQVYSLTAPPTIGLFDHAITYLPEFDLYADSTIGVAPMGSLSFGEYGKPVVHASQTGAIGRTPIIRPDEATIAFKAKARLDADGRLTGETETSATGPFATTLRGMAMNIQSSGIDASAKYLLSKDGLDGTGKFSIPPLHPLAESYKISGTYQARPPSGTIGGNSFYMPTGLWLGWQPGDLLAGPLYMPGLSDLAPTPCFNGKQTMEATLELPPGRRLKELPKGVEIRNEYLSYRSSWSQQGNTVTLSRQFELKAASPICVGSVRLEIAKALAGIRTDAGATLSLAP